MAKRVVNVLTIGANSKSTSHFKYTMWASYLGDRYQAHFLFSTNHEKMTENGGITNDDYITR